MTPERVFRATELKNSTVHQQDTMLLYGWTASVFTLVVSSVMGCGIVVGWFDDIPRDSFIAYVCATAALVSVVVLSVVAYLERMRNRTIGRSKTRPE